MRRLARPLFALCSAASLLLCVAICVLWVRSYSVADHFWFIHRSGHAQCVRSASGIISLECRRRDRDYDEPRPRLKFSHERGDWLGNLDPTQSPNTYAWKFGPFSFVKLVYHRGGWRWNLAVPAWLLVALTLPLPACWCRGVLIRRRRQRQRSAGRCLACGYDLRATPGRCPECGAAAADALRGAPDQGRRGASGQVPFGAGVATNKTPPPPKRTTPSGARGSGTR